MAPESISATLAQDLPDQQQESKSVEPQVDGVARSEMALTSNGTVVENKVADAVKSDAGTTGMVISGAANPLAETAKTPKEGSQSKDGTASNITVNHTQTDESSTAASKIKDTAASESHPTQSRTDEKDSPEPNSPTSAQTATTSQPEKLARPKQKDEKLLQAYIFKAHAQVRDGTAVASSDEAKEDAMVKYAEMVSQMTHLLSVVGVGRNTTVRALGYLNGPEQPTPAQALRQAKQDRREQYQKKRGSSEETKVSQKNSIQPADNTDVKTTTATASATTASDDSVSVITNTLTRSDQTGLANGAQTNKTNNENAKLETSPEEHATKGDTKSNSQKGFRRRWFGGKGRRHPSGKKNQDKAKGHRDVDNKGEKTEKEASVTNVDAVTGTSHTLGPAPAPAA